MITIDPSFTDQFKTCIQVGLGLVNKLWPITQNLYFKPCAGDSRNGWCQYPNRRHKGVCVIGINKLLLNENDIVTTVVHEVLHSFKDSQKDHHGGNWKKRVAVMKKTYPELSGLSRCNNYNRDENAYKYFVKCSDCGLEWKYSRKPYWFDTASARRRCPDCNTKHLVTFTK